MVHHIFGIVQRQDGLRLPVTAWAWRNDVPGQPCRRVLAGFLSRFRRSETLPRLPGDDDGRNHLEGQGRLLVPLGWPFGNDDLDRHPLADQAAR